MASSERAERTTAATTPSAAPAQAPANTGAFSRGAGSLDPEGQSGAPSWSETAEGQARLDGLRCNLLMNARYHASREAFLDTLHRALMFLTILSGATAIADLFPHPWIRSVFAAAAAAFAALDLTADLSNRARCHALMKRRYFELLADLVGEKRSLIEVEECMHRCGADEEPAFHALLAVSWNAAQEMVYGNAAHQYDIRN